MTHTIVPIRPDSVEPACYGIACPLHEHCARYHAAEGVPMATMATCQGGDGDRPHYVRRMVIDLQATAGDA